MTTCPDRNEWSEGSKRKHIVDQREYMWREDTIQMLAKWLGLKQGMIAVDVGCGLGYLGRAYWKYFGKGGLYCGLDLSDRLVRAASRLAEEWAIDGAAMFSVADAYAIPLDDNYADMTMCQTLLMHLKSPERALKEMIRVTKPGGVVMCKEPDNLSAELGARYSSVSTPDIKEQLLDNKTLLIWAEGRKKLGKGDYGIGIKVPKMMADLGLARIDIRANDKVHFLLPPYESPRQKFELEKMKERVNEEEIPRDEGQEYKEYFLAGGGSLSAYYRYWKRVREMRSRNWETAREQIANGTLFSTGSSSFFCIRGFKP